MITCQNMVIFYIKKSIIQEKPVTLEKKGWLHIAQLRGNISQDINVYSLAF